MEPPKRSEEPAYQAFVVSVALFNCGIFCGWLVGLLSGADSNIVDILAGVFTLVVVSIGASVLGYRYLREHYELSFYLAGRKPVVSDETPHGLLTPHSPTSPPDVDAVKETDSVAGYPAPAPQLALPGSAALTEEDIFTVTIRDGNGPGMDEVENAENDVRKIMEDGRPEEIESVIHGHFRLHNIMNPDLLWGKSSPPSQGFVQAVDRARQAAEAMEEFQAAIPAQPVGTDGNALMAPPRSPAGPRPIIAKDPAGEELWAKLDHTMAQLSDAHEHIQSLEHDNQKLVNKGVEMNKQLEALQAYKLMQTEYQTKVLSQATDQQGDIAALRSSLQDMTQAQDALRTQRFDVVMESGSYTLIAPNLLKKVKKMTSAENVAKIQDLHDATTMCNRVLKEVETFLFLSVYAARLQSFSSSEGANGEVPNSGLTYFAASPNEADLVGMTVPEQECHLTFQCCHKRKVILVQDLSAVQEIHYWKPKPPGQPVKGGVLMMPMSAEKGLPALGVLVVDSINREHKAISPEEKAALMEVGDLLSTLLVAGAKAQDNTQKQMIIAMDAKPSGWAGIMMQRMDLLYLKSRLESVLSGNGPEMRACIAEMLTYKPPPRNVVAICTSLLIITKADNVVDPLIQWLGKVTVPTHDDMAGKLWINIVQKALTDCSSKLGSMMQAVEWRLNSKVETDFETAESLLETINLPSDITRVFNSSNIFRYIYPWLKCTLTLRRLAGMVTMDTIDQLTSDEQEESLNEDLSDASSKILDMVEARLVQDNVVY
eukprot:gene1460-2083_t